MFCNHDALGLEKEGHPGAEWGTRNACLFLNSNTGILNKTVRRRKAFVCCLGSQHAQIQPPPAPSIHGIVTNRSLSFLSLLEPIWLLATSLRIIVTALIKYAFKHWHQGAQWRESGWLGHSQAPRQGCTHSAEGVSSAVPLSREAVGSR